MRRRAWHNHPSVAPLTTILLIRHGHTDAVGTRLVSRSPGIHLSAEGERQAALVRDRLAPMRLDAIYASPLERAMETARAVAEPHAMAVRVDEGLNEIEFGDWTGLTFKELSARADWQAFINRRASATVPNGEAAPEVQRRIVATLDQLRVRHPGGTIAAVSHADVIRNAVLHAAGVSIDCWYRFEIAPASITAIGYDDRGPHLVLVNETPGRPPRTG